MLFPVGLPVEISADPWRLRLLSEADWTLGWALSRDPEVLRWTLYPPEAFYALLPQGRHRGAATAAALALSEWEFSVGVKRVLLLTITGNTASEAVATRAGFVPDGEEFRDHQGSPPHPTMGTLSPESDSVKSGTPTPGGTSWTRGAPSRSIAVQVDLVGAVTCVGAFCQWLVHPASRLLSRDQAGRSAPRSRGAGGQVAARARVSPSGYGHRMPDYTVRALDDATWPAFAELVERNNGIFGGCWCMGMHPKPEVGDPTPNRERKRDRVSAGTAHAALVFDGGECLGWSQFGSPQEVPRIKNRAVYEQHQSELPNWRIGCCFVGKGHRREGVSAAALAGALDLISELGGGVVEGYPEPAGAVPAGFLYHGALSTFESLGFTKDRKLGKHRWVVKACVKPKTL
jgi:hypothetical protein